MSKNPFRYFKTSPEIIKLAVMMYVRFPLSLRNVEDLLHERGIDVCHESVRLWVDRFGTHFASKIRKQRASYMRQVTWVAVASRSSLRQNQRRPTLPLAGRRPRRGSLQKFAAMHSSAHNHFNHQRNIETRTRFKQLRNAAVLQ